MERYFEEVYNYLLTINKLEKREYDELIALYGSKLVDSVIEYMISKDEKNIHKFDYYVALLTSRINDFSNESVLSMYINDISAIDRLSLVENKRYMLESYTIIEELRNIFDGFECKYVKNKDIIFNSIVDEIEFYLRQCNNKEILSRIKELYSRFISVRNKLINGNIKVVVAAAKSYYKDDDSFIEIIQYGNIGLMKAVEKYNPKYETAFSTYAYYWVKSFFRAALKLELNSRSSLSYNMLEKNDVRLRTIDLLSNEFGRTPTQKEVAMRMGISVEKLSEIEISSQYGVSLYSKVSLEDDNECTLLEICEGNSVNVEEEVCSKELFPLLMQYMDKCLNERQKVIILNRYRLCDNPLSMDELIKELKICRQRIEQEKRKALIKIREYAGNKLFDYLK